MNINHMLQGLLGGVGQGLGGIQQMRQQNVENQMKDRAVQVDELNAKRAQQAMEFEKRKAQYQALNPDTDLTPEEAQPYVSDGFKFIKGATGMRRPETIEERVAKLQFDVDTQRALSDAKYAPQAADNALDRATKVEIVGLENDQADQTLGNQLKIAGMNNATDRYSADKSYDGRLAVAEATGSRLDQTALNKPIDDMEFEVWKKRTYLKDPQNAKYYNEALAAGVSPTQMDTTMRKLYAQSRTPFAAVR